MFFGSSGEPNKGDDTFNENCVSYFER
jgi:hypothetical protein